MGVRELTVQFGRDDWVLMVQDDGSRRIHNAATLDRVWLDEDSGAFRWEHAVRRDAPPVIVSVFDGRRAAGSYGSGSGPRLIRYEGAPEVVARLAGWVSVDVARAYVGGTAVPRGFRVAEPGDQPPADPFALPGGTQTRLWRQLDPIPSGATDVLYGLGEAWDGGAPEFAASLQHFTGEHRRAAVVAYPGVCVTTSERRAADPRVGATAVALADGSAATAAVGRTRRDGSFGVRPPEALKTIGFVGYELALSGVGKRGLVVETERHTIVVTGTMVGNGAISEIAPLLRPL